MGVDPVVVVGGARVFAGDCRDVLKGLPDNSVDSVVTDPPYELGFMGKKWDSSGIAYDVTVWQECLRVLKPGGHLLAFGGSRTYHRLGVAIEDAGFEIRDTIAWISSKTFPKSLNVSKAIDKKLGAERTEILGWTKKGMPSGANKAVGHGEGGEPTPVTAAVTLEAKQWQGWGTGLKQVVEPVVMARKPLDGTVAENTLRWGVSGLNITASRIPGRVQKGAANNFVFTPGGESDDGYVKGTGAHFHNEGRWPANVILDDVSAGLLDDQSGENPSRFFYQAKASKRDRNEGLENVNAHPTVKPTQLMRYLIKLVTPYGGVVLDPFTGSGSTGKAALLEGYQFIGAELTEEYLPIIEGRLRWASEQNGEHDDTLF
jgi:site-specific DNA-methyltransferase (adenine-specific)